jgi:mannosyltransferase OCH1-like enzyme
LKEFPNIAEVFHSFEKGEHKSDLFRYYFLYVKGGVFMDTDAMIEVDIDTIEPSEPEGV